MTSRIEGCWGSMSSDEDDISPLEIFVTERFDIAVDQPHVPVRRQQTGDRQQAQRHGRILVPRNSHAARKFQKDASVNSG